MEEREDRWRNWRSLRDRRDFERVYREGTKFVGRLLVLYLLPAADNAKAVVASRKVGGAVQRNRAKRLLREALSASLLGRADAIAATQQRMFPAQTGDVKTEAPPGGLWIVAVARTRILEAKSQDVSSEIDGFIGPE